MTDTKKNHEEIVGKPPLIHTDLSGLTQTDIEGLLRTEEAANYWLSYGIGEWAAKAEAMKKGLERAWDALKWKRQNPINQIDEARDIVDDTLQRPRLDGFLGSDSDAPSVVRGLERRPDER